MAAAATRHAAPGLPRSSAVTGNQPGHCADCGPASSVLNVLYRLGYALEFPSDVRIFTEGNQLASCKNIKKVIKVTEFCSTFCLHTSGARRWDGNGKTVRKFVMEEWLAVSSS